MAAGPWETYPAFLQGVSEKRFNLGFGGDLIQAVLLNSSYVFTGSEVTWADISAFELPTALGYTAGGTVLQSQTISRSGISVWFASNDISWPLFSATCKYCVLVRQNAGSLSPSDLLIGVLDLNLTGPGTDVTGLGGTFTIQNSAIHIFDIH